MGSLPAHFPVISDKADPTKEIRAATDYLRTLISRLEVKSKDSAQYLTRQQADALYSPGVLKRVFQTGGAFPLNVHDLPGVLAQPQNAATSTGTSTPSLLSPLSQNGTLFVVTPAKSLYYFDGIARVWTQLTSGPGVGYNTIDSGGVALTQRSTLNIITTSGLVGTDNAGSSRTDIGFSSQGATQVLAGPTPSFRVLAVADLPAHNILSATHGDTLAAAVVRGDLIVGNATPAWSRLAKGTFGTYPRAGSSDVTYATLPTADVPANVTAVTVNAGVVTAQNLQSLTIPANTLNVLGATFIVAGFGSFTTQAAQTPTVTIAITLGGVSIFSMTSQAAVAGVTNPWNFEIWVMTSATGATGTLEVHGQLRIDDNLVPANQVNTYCDKAGASAAIDLTSAQTLQVTVTFSTNPGVAPFNSCTERTLAIK